MRIIILLGLFMSLFFITCTEQPDLTLKIENFTVDTTYIDSEIPATQERILLVEEFTGVYCYTCPLAHHKVDTIKMLYPNKVAAVNVHSKFFGIYDNPNVMGNAYDFRTEDSDTVVSMLGGVLSLPSGAIDRTIYSGETSIISKQREFWKDYAAQAIQEPVNVKIDLHTEFNASSRQLKVVVKAHYLNNISTDNYIGVLLTESNIIDKQFVDTVIVPNYSHEHILRDYLTNPKGDLINNDTERGQVIVRVFYYNVPATWNENNVELIAFIHEKGSNWKVLQTNKKMIK